MSKLKIALAILSWNHMEYTDLTFKSLFASITPSKKYDYHYFLFDDGSTDDTLNLVSKYKSQKLNIIGSLFNEGTVKNANKAYYMTKDCDYFLILNNDLKFAKDWAPKLLDGMISMDADLAGPVTNAPGPHKLQDIRNYVDNYKLSDKQNIINEVAQKITNLKPFTTSLINGFALAIKQTYMQIHAYEKDKFFKAGPVPEFGIETEFQKRTKTVPVIVPSSFLFHYKQITVEKLRNNFKDQRTRLKNE